MNSIQRSGFVYILHAEGTNRFKIGYSLNPKVRCQDLSLYSPFPIKLIHCYPSSNAYRDEQKLHKMFSSRRVYREWFIFDSVEHAKGLVEEFFEIRSLAQETDLSLLNNENAPLQYLNQQKEGEQMLLEQHAKIKIFWDKVVAQSNKKPSEAAEAVYKFLCETFTGEPIPARDCYRKSSLRTQYGLNAEITEQIFDELQMFRLGEKSVKDINGFRSVTFLPNN